MGFLGFVLEGQTCETENFTHSQDIQRILIVRKWQAAFEARGPVPYSETMCW